MNSNTNNNSNKALQLNTKENTKIQSKRIQQTNSEQVQELKSSGSDPGPRQ